MSTSSPRPATDRFAVWAPLPRSVTLVADGTRVEMARDEAGWWHPVDLPEALATGEVDYGYLLDDEPTPRPDPRSRRQPEGVHGLSRTFDPGAHVWQDDAWRGRQLAGAVIYEMHVGTFTPEGTFAAAEQRLDHLVELGVDLVEVLPVNGFNGTHNWGYDGVLWYTVHEQYGGPAAYQHFVDACHQRGLGVLQDVVYNHLGPSGNYLPEFGPYYNDKANTTWGTAINLDGEGSDTVRRYVLDNALMWMRDMHVDGLRLDAVHALADPGRAVDVLEQLALETDALSAAVGRPLTLIAESDLNNPRLITPRHAGGFGLTGQWSDDFHHALLANLTGDVSGWFADFAGLDALAKVLTRGFFHDGCWSSFRRRSHGRPLDLVHTEAWRLVVYSANHDQIGNRADGSRPRSRMDQAQLATAAAFTLLGPSTPMVFMGEEWGAATPWAFFSSHPEPELGRAVSEGRLAEFAEMNWDPDSVPDPQDPQTFASSRLDWSEPEGGEHADLLQWYRELIRLRRSRPELTDPRWAEVSVNHDAEQGWLVLTRGRRTSVAAGFGTGQVRVPLQRAGLPAGVQLLGSRGEVSLDGDALVLDGHAVAVLDHGPDAG
ncbi:malto-oligosyltrehalose trehalohydrolase [Auraticoccus sp. F435]|uniref:Malto-oligosyltrehalose trehalohydrolase n=1 Tax=Auraticoccus cholistanensis TaxID=2656650 RepID=A0A6A9UVG6_9ACTN|nr:malto-oligosyltrehalose trehalohydrolase [Auraticoccus cholistanensis]MVA75564.1 malto-oligosyltrehalose trehalohydrolase [Auraticoccus cholistanensis]